MRSLQDVSTESRSFQESKKMSPQSQGHCKKPEGCLPRTDATEGNWLMVQDLRGCHLRTDLFVRSLDSGDGAS